jgi:hypothetical protein
MSSIFNVAAALERPANGAINTYLASGSLAIIL